MMRKGNQVVNTRVKSNKKLNILGIFTFLFCVYFVYTLCEQQVQINKYDSQIDMYKADIQSKSQLIDHYNKQKNNIETDEYIENVARETLGYVKPYEKIFVDANK